ncbi:MAG: hypothetical protein ACK5YR_21125 [Pirellula sp.]
MRNVWWIIALGIIAAVYSSGEIACGDTGIADLVDRSDRSQDSSHRTP